MTDPPADPVCDCAGRLIETNAHEAHCATMQRPARYSIVGDWLAVDVDECTCGIGDGMHEQGCGSEPLLLLSGLRASGLVLAPMTGEVEYGVRWNGLYDEPGKVTTYGNERGARSIIKTFDGAVLVSRPILGVPWMDVDA